MGAVSRPLLFAAVAWLVLRAIQAASADDAEQREHPREAGDEDRSADEGR